MLGTASTSSPHSPPSTTPDGAQVGRTRLDIRRTIPRGVMPEAATIVLYIAPGIERARPLATSFTPASATSLAVHHANDRYMGPSELVLLTLWNSVRVSPGHNAVTCTPVPRTSSWRLSDNEVTYALVAAYTARRGAAWNPATLLTLSR